MNDELHNNYSPIHDTTMVKVFLCGPLRLLRRENQSFDQLPSYQDIPSTDWDERPGPTFNLLKLLLCCENRHASKTFLAGTLWPESGEREARHSLSQAARALRSVLRMNGEEQKSETKTKSLLFDSPGGEGFQLADQTLLWVDVDTFEEAMKQATRAERKKQSDEARTWWERAYTLSKLGTFLPDDVYQEWTNARRLNHELLVPRCVRRLAECYVAEERYEEAEEVLRPYWVAHLTDEDILTLLMQTLHTQGREREALLLYEQTKQALEEDGLDPLSRTTDLAERIRRKPPERKHQPLSSVTTPLPPREMLHRQTTTDTMNTRASINPLPEAQENAWLTQGASHMGQLLAEGWSISDVLDSLQVVLQGVQGMPIATRRKLLVLRADAMIQNIPILTSKQISHEELLCLHDTLGESIAAGWELFHSAGNAQVFAVGQALLHVAQQNHSLLFPRVRSLFYSTLYNLTGSALHFQEDYQAALDAHMNAHVAALSTGDPWQVAQSLICQADSYQALKQHVKAIEVIEEALNTLKNSMVQEHIRTKAHALACWADNAMMMGDHLTAQKMLEASATYLDQIGSAEEFDRTSWLQLAGKNALLAGDYTTAIYHFEEALSQLPRLLRSAGILLLLAIAYARANERDASLSVAKKLVPVISTMDAPMINGYFIEYVRQDLLGTFPKDQEVLTFVKETKHQLPQFSSL